MSRLLRFASIADDYTGGSDLTGMLAAHGVRAVQFFGVPRPELLEAARGEYDAAVVCLKSRSIDPGDACRLTLTALESLAPLQPAQWQFKYCSTFDSTARGNIGPVTATLMDRLGVDFTTAIPALPVNGRTQYNGYLFVGDVLLSESPMKDHPLNPMREPNLVRHLQAQTTRKVGLIPHDAVRGGPAAIHEAIERLRSTGVEIALVDVLVDDDLDRIAEALAEAPLITGGSGITAALARYWRRLGMEPFGATPALESGSAPGVLVIAGSCSTATLRQLDEFTAAGDAITRLDVPRLVSDREGELARLQNEIRGRPVAAVASSMAPADRERLLTALERDGHSPEDVRMAIESGLAELARRFVGAEGTRRLIVAGGETAGAVIDTLGVGAVEVVDTLDPGVPSLITLDQPRLLLALKSGNFGSPDFFSKTVRYLENR